MIQVERLRKAFGPLVAVDGISFAAGRGDVLGFLGPNGAGKSTTMRMLCCFLRPDRGTARVCGHDIRTETVAVRRRMGYLAENAPLYDEMTVRAFLNFACDARGMPRKARRDAIERILGRCALEAVVYQPVGTLSKGYRRRVGLAQALVHDPEVLVLDEPTDGLDPNQKHHVRELIRALSGERCIVISTHILEEVEAVCNRAVIIARGRVLADSTPRELMADGESLDAVFRRLTAPDAEAAA